MTPLTNSVRSRLALSPGVNGLSRLPTFHHTAAPLTCKSWPVEGWSTQTHQLHVFWDLDNKRPDQASHYPSVVKSLKSELQRGGSIKQLRAYANTRTCVEHEAETLDALVMREVASDGLRCSLCGKHCKTAAQLSKHFRQLHQSEHRKRMAGPPKRARTYLASPKAQRYREGATSAGMSSRLGPKGRTLKVLLNTLGCTLFDVQQVDQAADEALVRHATKLLSTQSPVVGASEGASTSHVLNVLVVVSDDAGFVPLLQSAQRRGWCTVVVCSSYQVLKFEGLVDGCIQWEVVYPDAQLDDGSSSEDGYEFDDEFEDFDAVDVANMGWWYQ